jgi:hypothetical protein
MRLVSKFVLGCMAALLAANPIVVECVCAIPHGGARCLRGCCSTEMNSLPISRLACVGVTEVALTAFCVQTLCAAVSVQPVVLGKKVSTNLDSSNPLWFRHVLPPVGAARRLAGSSSATGAHMDRHLLPSSRSSLIVHRVLIRVPFCVC